MMRRTVLRAAAVLAFLTAALPGAARADVLISVRLSNQNLAIGVTDVAVSGGIEDYMRIVRVYNSTWPFNHVFGYGWGSELDTSLLPLPGDELWYTAFGNGFSRVLSETSAYDLNAMRDAVENGALEDGVIGSTDEKQAYSNLTLWEVNYLYEVMRYTGYLTPREAAAGEIFNDSETGPARVVAVPEGYQMFVPSGSTVPFEALFDNGGKLIRAWVHGQPQQFVSYGWGSLKSNLSVDRERVVSMADYRQNRFRLSYDGDGRVIRIDAERFGSLQYGYDRFGNLVWARDPSGMYRYAYNGYHDLTRIEYPQGGAATFQYEGAGGNVTGLQCSDGRAYEFQRLSGELGAPTSVRIISKERGTSTSEIVNPSNVGVRAYCS